MTDMPAVPAEYLTHLESLLRRGGRVVLGLAGPPGGGKSTLSAALQRAFGARAVVVPMDGYHLANEELARLGRAERKGAPDTFDAHGYIALLRRLREAQRGETVYAPEFRREIEQAIAGAIPVPADVPLVVTEGNYLLVDTPPWAGVRELLDECWYVDMDEPTRLERLVARHVRHGRSPEAARAWVESTDEPNARLIESTRGRADLQFRWP